jgi:hypothetical protein
MKIQCPDCDQEFDVAEDFLGKNVECGACDNLFRVNDDHVITEKKRFYPGEKKGTGLSKFGDRAPVKPSEVAFVPASYQSDVDPELVGPPRPRRTIAVFGGIFLMVTVVVIFLLGGGKEGPLRDIETPNRYVVCGFSALIGSALLIYGAARNRWLGVMVAVVLSLILMFMPTLFPGNPISSFIKPIDSNLQFKEEVKNEIQKESVGDYLIRIGYDPVEEALFVHPRTTVVGIYIRNADYSVQSKIAAYLYHATGGHSREVLFPRGDNGQAAMILLVEQRKSIEEIATLCERFGQVVRTEQDLRLLEVYVDSSATSEPDPEKLNNPDDPDYEFLNLSVLKSFDPEGHLETAKRLSKSKPKALRVDITEQLAEMLPSSYTDLQLAIIEALKTWAEPSSDIGGALLEASKKLHAQGRVSPVTMELLIRHKVDGCGAILMDLWNKDPARWSDYLLRLGAGAELVILPEIEKMESGRIVKASEILGKVGTKHSVDFLTKLIADSKVDAKKAKSLQAAIDEIKKRS